MEPLNIRQQHIVELLNQQEYCSIDDLASAFSVTTQTIRRDINALCDLGMARRHHGGVGLPGSLSNRSYVTRQVTHQAEKQRIAQAVVREIPDGSTIFLGIGTTIAAIAEHLGHLQSLRVITNNFEAAQILTRFPQIETWMPGGRIRCNDRDIVGDTVASFFGQFYADIGIIGCAAVSHISASKLLAPDPAKASGSETVLGTAKCLGTAKYLCTDNSPAGDVETASVSTAFAMEYELREAKVSQAILSGSQQTWLVANRTKWQRKANAIIAPLHSFDRVFSGDQD
ncbi:DeoR/GlpR family DNA-binding transcription regulator [Photobacterium ganghwense]|uniref:DeoR/GlpR family DNA-binding transcription regulator n=1 Tax=Photobacterium ganghwense TaxID=320778 RepID=UPI0039F08AEB